MAVGCAKQHEEVLEIQPEFVSYVERFKADAKANGRDLQINDLKVVWGSTKTAEKPGTNPAICQHGPDKTPTVIISNDEDSTFIWDKAADAFKEAIIYHELGHCVLKRAHNESTWSSEKGTFANSIMYPSLPNIDYYADPDIHQHYMNELFK